MQPHLDAAELAVAVDAVERERGADAIAELVGEIEVPGHLAAGERILRIDLRKRLAEDVARHLAGRLVLQAAGRGIEVVLALVCLRRGPVLGREVLLELRVVDRDDLHLVVAGLHALQDRFGQQLLGFLPVRRVENVLPFAVGGGDSAREQNARCGKEPSVGHSHLEILLKGAGTGGLIESRFRGCRQRSGPGEPEFSGASGTRRSSPRSLSHSQSSTDPTISISGLAPRLT